MICQTHDCASNSTLCDLHTDAKSVFSEGRPRVHTSQFLGDDLLFRERHGRYVGCNVGEGTTRAMRAVWAGEVCGRFDGVRDLHHEFAQFSSMSVFLHVHEERLHREENGLNGVRRVPARHLSRVLALELLYGAEVAFVIAQDVQADVVFVYVWVREWGEERRGGRIGGVVRREDELDVEDGSRVGCVFRS